MYLSEFSTLKLFLYAYIKHNWSYVCIESSAGFRTNEAPYLGPEGDRPNRTQFYHYVRNRSETERLQIQNCPT